MLRPYCVLFYRYSGNVDPALLPSQRAIAFMREHESASEALLMEPRNVFDEAIIGVTNIKDCDQWSRTAFTPIFVYDSELCIQAKVRHGDYCDLDNIGAYPAAADAFYYNRDAWVGKGTPTFIDNWDEGFAAKAMRSRLRNIRHKLYLYTRMVGMFLAAKVRVNFSPGGPGAREAAEEFVESAAKVVEPPPPKRQRRTSRTTSEYGSGFL